ncbi:probable aspartyl aminopeptidase [Phtheirospermum japonicum]|uniref:Probable aspartyl aminopeptidase n=1 Tax=Phtheirospermum japonicum TaxID=374723 RepID=A0A830DM74_9LAMI|nr:probable aspartyl aminopeptidase [Phtheirospermum japonicum]
MDPSRIRTGLSELRSPLCVSRLWLYTWTVPEMYKQWQVRNMRAGFEQLPLNKEMMRIARNRVKWSYHKDFVIDEDGHWFFQWW